MKINYRHPAFLLFAVFFILRVTDHVDWSWWIVTLPLYGGIVLTLLFDWIYWRSLTPDERKLHRLSRMLGGDE